MADFIFNQDHTSFRKACQNINRGLYIELKQMSEWIRRFKQVKKNVKTDFNGEKRSNFAATSEILKDVGIDITDGFKNVVKHVFSDHIKRLQEKKQSIDKSDSIDRTPGTNRSHVDPMLGILRENRDDKQKIQKQPTQDLSKFFINNLASIFRRRTKTRSAILYSN